MHRCLQNETLQMGTPVSCEIHAVLMATANRAPLSLPLSWGLNLL